MLVWKMVRDPIVLGVPLNIHTFMAGCTDSIGNENRDGY